MRNGLSLSLATKKAQVIPEDSKKKIVNWLQINRRAQAKFNFELSNKIAMDQTPISVEFLDNKTYDTKACPRVAVFLFPYGSFAAYSIARRFLCVSGVPRSQLISRFLPSPGHAAQGKQ